MASAPVAPTTVRTGMSLTDYLARSGERFELIDGEEIPMSPRVFGQDDLRQNLFLVLQRFADAHQSGEMWIASTFAVPFENDFAWVTGSVVPDVMFFAGDRLVAYKGVHPDWFDLPLYLAPDMAVEIQSRTDRNAAIFKKVAYMLSVGVQVVWVINLSHHSVTVYTAEGDPRPLTGDALLSTELLPGWSIVVKDLFADEFGAQ